MMRDYRQTNFQTPILYRKALRQKRKSNEMKRIENEIHERPHTQIFEYFVFYSGKLQCPYSRICGIYIIRSYNIIMLIIILVYNLEKREILKFLIEGISRFLPRKLRVLVNDHTIVDHLPKIVLVSQPALKFYMYSNFIKVRGTEHHHSLISFTGNSPHFVRWWPQFVWRRSFPQATQSHVRRFNSSNASPFFDILQTCPSLSFPAVWSVWSIPNSAGLTNLSSFILLRPNSLNFLPSFHTAGMFCRNPFLLNTSTLVTRWNQRTPNKR